MFAPKTSLLLCYLFVSISILYGCKKNDNEESQGRRKQRISDLAEVASPLDTGVSSNSKQRFVNLIRYRLNLMLGKKAQSSRWDLWAEGSTTYPLDDGRKAFLVSFRLLSSQGNQKGLLVIGRMEGDMAAVMAQWEIDASIDDIHVVDLGLPSGVLIHTVSMSRGKDFNTLYNHLLRYEKGKIFSTWSVLGGYETSSPGSYMPPIIRFVDTNKNGKKEVLVTQPGKQTKKNRSRRWARFVWDDYKRAFIPDKNLAWSGIASQRPVWALTGFMEGLSEKDEETARDFLHGNRDGCQHPDDLIYAFNPEVWRRSGSPAKIQEPFDKSQSPRVGRIVVKMPLRKRKEMGRYEAHVELIKSTEHIPNSSMGSNSRGTPMPDKIKGGVQPGSNITGNSPSSLLADNSSDLTLSRSDQTGGLSSWSICRARFLKW